MIVSQVAAYGCYGRPVYREKDTVSRISLSLKPTQVPATAVYSLNLHPKPTQVPAIYLSNYSRAIELADELSLVRPDQSYRETYDKQCEELLDNPLAVYMVYTLEEGDDRSVHFSHLTVLQAEQSSLSFAQRE